MEGSLPEGDDDRELAPEPGQGRNARGREKPDDGRGAGDRHLRGQSPQEFHVPRMGAFLDRRGIDEQERFEYRMIEEVETGAGYTENRARAETDDDVSHLAYAGIGQHALQIVLAEGQERAGDDARRADEKDYALDLGREAENPGNQAHDDVDAVDLGDDPREEYGHGGRG